MSERIEAHCRDIKLFKENTDLYRLYLDNEGSYVNFEEEKVLLLGNNPFGSIIKETVEIIARDLNSCNDNFSDNMP